jgi:hypothetical protein
VALEEMAIAVEHDRHRRVPAHVAICFGLAPAAIHNATAECRRSCGRNGISPASLTAG